MTDKEVRDVAEQIKALSLPQKLRLAADLFEEGTAPRLAEGIVERVALDLSAARALQVLGGRSR